MRKNSSNAFVKQPDVAYELVPRQNATETSTSHAGHFDLEEPAVTAVAVQIDRRHDPDTTPLPPEAQNLSWVDSFFDDNDDEYDGIIAVFDFDYDAIQCFKSKEAWLEYTLLLILVLFCCLLFRTAMETEYSDYALTALTDNDLTTWEWVCLISFLILIPFAIIGLMNFVVQTVFLVPCFAYSRAGWDVQSQHIAINQEGICFVKVKRPPCCGLSCLLDAAQMRTTILFDQISDCYIVEPAGNHLFCILRTLTKVTVTVRTDIFSGNEQHHESPKCTPQIEFLGLKEATAFRDLVLAMKRQRQVQLNPSLVGHFLTDQAATIAEAQLITSL